MEHPPSFDDGRPAFNHQLARELLGKHVLVGITYLKSSGEFFDQRQFHGTVKSADPVRGIVLELMGDREGETYCLPPGTGAFEKARPGEYRLRSTGEVVIDPDFTCSWTLTQPERK